MTDSKSTSVSKIETIKLKSEKYGLSWCLSNSSKLAPYVGEYLSSRTPPSNPILVRVYNKNDNKVEEVKLESLLELVLSTPKEPVPRPNAFGQIRLESEVFVSVSIYASLLCLIGPFSIGDGGSSHESGEEAPRK